MRARWLLMTAAASLTALAAASPAAAAEFIVTQNVAIPDGNAAGVPIDIAVSGLGGIVTDVNFIVSGLAHSWRSDLSFTLTAPNGSMVTLMSGVGGSSDFVGGNVTFDQQAATALPASGNVGSGTFLPKSSLASFNGLAPNGIWRFVARDAFPSDAGRLSGVTLSITSTGAVPEPATWAMLIAGFGMVGLVARRRGRARLLPV